VPEQWQNLVPDLQVMVELLEGESVFDETRLPTTSVVAVLTALARELPKSGDGLGNARGLLRYYIWRAFLTRRYESSAGSRTFQDYVALRDAIRAGTPLDEVDAPIFDEAVYPIPNPEQLLTARWPKTRDTLARGVLALALREGGRDIADDAVASRSSIRKREYHHLFPDSILIKRGGLSEGESFRALNCALVTWQTNRQVSNRSPLEYLQDRVTRSDLGEAQVAARLASHLVPWASLAASGPYAADVDSAVVAADYEKFLDERAALVAAKAAERCGAGLVGTSAAAGRPRL